MRGEGLGVRGWGLGVRGEGLGVKGPGLGAVSCSRVVTLRCGLNQNSGDLIPSGK